MTDVDVAAASAPAAAKPTRICVGQRWRDEQNGFTYTITAAHGDGDRGLWRADGEERDIPCYAVHVLCDTYLGMAEAPAPVPVQDAVVFGRVLSREEIAEVTEQLLAGVPVDAVRAHAGKRLADVQRSAPPAAPEPTPVKPTAVATGQQWRDPNHGPFEVDKQLASDKSLWFCLVDSLPSAACWTEEGILACEYLGMADWVTEPKREFVATYDLPCARPRPGDHGKAILNSEGMVAALCNRPADHPGVDCQWSAERVKRKSTAAAPIATCGMCDNPGIESTAHPWAGFPRLCEEHIGTAMRSHDRENFRVAFTADVVPWADAAREPWVPSVTDEDLLPDAP